MDRLNILILHKMGDPQNWRNAVKNLEYLLPTNCSENNYIVHPSELPLPKYIKHLNFHGIILGPTFLCHRYYPKRYARILKQYQFIEDSNAYKIALPQDDYDCSAILDEWLVKWKIDEVYSVIPTHREILYPEYSKVGIIKDGYTGYISDDWIQTWQHPKPFEQRTIDVSYRANKLPPNFGRIGMIKGVIGERFTEATRGSELKLDISTDPKDMIPGNSWNTFVENSKHCLASNSGSSLIDPRGEIRRSVNDALKQNPQASFEEVERLCFPGKDSEFILTAISPRNLEAALAETVQIMTPGDYNGLLSPDSEYLIIHEDCSNITEVIEKMNDTKLRKNIIKNCKEKLLSIKELREKYHANRLLESIYAHQKNEPKMLTDKNDFQHIKNRYSNEIYLLGKSYWLLRRSLKNAFSIIKFQPSSR